MRSVSSTHAGAPPWLQVEKVAKEEANDRGMLAQKIRATSEHRNLRTRELRNVRIQEYDDRSNTGE